MANPNHILVPLQIDNPPWAFTNVSLFLYEEAGYVFHQIFTTLVFRHWNKTVAINKRVMYERARYYKRVQKASCI
jgi:hypothetical protein